MPPHARRNHYFSLPLPARYHTREASRDHLQFMRAGTKQLTYNLKIAEGVGWD